MNFMGVVLPYFWDKKYLLYFGEKLDRVFAGFDFAFYFPDFLVDKKRVLDLAGLFLFLFVE